MEKTLNLKMLRVDVLESNELKSVSGGWLGFLIWAAGSISAGLIASEANKNGGLAEEEYASMYEGLTGLQYEGWEGGY